MSNVQQPNVLTDLDAPEHRVRKRRRRTMACTQCRSRKLRCDREYPTCGRCRKSKAPTKCTYEDGFLWQQPNTVTSTVFSDRGPTGSMSVPNPNPNLYPRVDRTSVNSTNTSPDSGLRIRPLPARPHPPVEERRDRFLETVLGAPKAAVNQEPYVTEPLQRPKHALETVLPSYPLQDDGPVSPSQQLDLAPRMMMRGKETKTRFNGGGVIANVMAQFTDLKPFAEEIRLSNANLARLRPDLERVKRGLWKREIHEPFPEPVTASLIAMLPARRVVDELTSLYLTYIEPVHRIFHVPSFLRDLEEFWIKMDSPNMVNPAFVVTLLLVLSCAWNLADSDTLSYKNEAPLSCFTPVEWVLHSEKWIQNAQIKRPEITALRMYCLLIIAQNALGMKRSKAWLMTGTLIKQAMLAGYHRDPSRYAKISVFNKEMRRRMWTTIVELDLQVALDRGMPPSVQASDYDTAPVSNLNDDELCEAMTELPASRPLDEFTDSSFPAALGESLPLRLHVCSMIHSPRINCRYDEILRMDWEFGKHLAAIPAWRLSDMDDLRKQHKVTLMNSLLEAKISQTLLCLHTPFAIEAQKDTLFAPSARARLEVATTILSTQKRLYETSRQLSLCNLGDGDWTSQACASTCQLLHASGSSQSLTLTRTLPGLPETLTSLVETILTAFEARLMLIVKGAKDYFFMSTIMALVKAKLWPEQAAMFKQQVVERILSFAQTLFSRHANCAHLGAPGMGSFGANPVSGLTPGAGMAAPFAPDFEGMLQSNFGITPPGELDAFLDVFDWEDLTGINFAE